MAEDLYQAKLLRLAGCAHGAGRLEGRCCSGRAANTMCGDDVTFDVRVDAAGAISEIANDLNGCILVQASASLLARQAPGATAADIAALREAVEGMLNGGAPPPGGWADYAAFAGAAEYRSRHSCVLLPIEALQKALKDCPPHA